MSELLHYKSNDSDFVRTDNPGAVVNIDNEALLAYKAMKAKFNKINSVDQLSARIDRVEALLEKILEKL